LCRTKLNRAETGHMSPGCALQCGGHRHLEPIFFLRKGVSLGYVERNYNLKDLKDPHRLTTSGGAANLFTANLLRSWAVQERLWRPQDPPALHTHHESARPSRTAILGILSHLGILSPIPCRMNGVTLPHTVTSHYKEIQDGTCGRPLFLPAKPYSHTMSMCVSSARAEPFRQSHAFVWELTKETIHLPLGCLQGGFRSGPLWGSKPVSLNSCDPQAVPP